MRLVVVIGVGCTIEVGYVPYRVITIAMAVLAGAIGICSGTGELVEPIVAEGLGLVAIDAVDAVDAVGDGGDVAGIVVGVAEVLQVGTTPVPLLTCFCCRRRLPGS